MVRDRLARIRQGLGGKFGRLLPARGLGKWLALTVGLVFLGLVVLGLYWSNEPEEIDVAALAEQHAADNGREFVVGYTTTYTLMHLTNTLLDKSGGYLSNDVMPPSIWLDNMPSWEFGAIVQLRDMSRAMRKSMSRSQSQSTEDPDLARAEPLMHFDHNSWILPSTESEYRRSIDYFDAYLMRLSDPENSRAQFYARSDNLRQWLDDVENRLGSLSQRLSASVGHHQLNLNLANDPSAQQSTPSALQRQEKTPRLMVDNIYYEARGSAWALLHLLKAVESDFGAILENKNARVSLQQIIRELEATQRTLWSPVVLNGSGVGVLANHSLVMANYISRANAAIIDLRDLLSTG